MPEISGDDQLLSVPRQTHGILLKKASVRWEIEHQLIELSRADPAIWIVTEFPPSCLVSQFMEMTQVLWVSRPGTDTDLMRYSPSHRDIQVAVLMHKNKRDLESLVEGHPQAPHVYKFVNAHLGILAQMIGSPLEYLEFVIIQRLDARDASEVHSVQVSQPAHLFCFTLLTNFKEATVEVGSADFRALAGMNRTWVVSHKQADATRLTLSNIDVKNACLLMAGFRNRDTETAA